MEAPHRSLSTEGTFMVVESEFASEAGRTGTAATPSEAHRQARWLPSTSFLELQGRWQSIDSSVTMPDTEYLFVDQLTVWKSALEDRLLEWASALMEALNDSACAGSLSCCNRHLDLRVARRCFPTTVGVTGSNGKTTTAFIVDTLLSEATQHLMLEVKPDYRSFAYSKSPVETAHEFWCPEDKHLYTRPGVAMTSASLWGICVADVFRNWQRTASERPIRPRVYRWVPGITVHTTENHWYWCSEVVPLLVAGFRATCTLLADLRESNPPEGQGPKLPQPASLWLGAVEKRPGAIYPYKWLMACTASQSTNNSDKDETDGLGEDTAQRGGMTDRELRSIVRSRFRTISLTITEHSRKQQNSEREIRALIRSRLRLASLECQKTGMTGSIGSAPEIGEPVAGGALVEVTQDTGALPAPASETRRILVSICRQLRLMSVKRLVLGLSNDRERKKILEGVWSSPQQSRLTLIRKSEFRHAGRAISVRRHPADNEIRGKVLIAEAVSAALAESTESESSNSSETTMAHMDGRAIHILKHAIARLKKNTPSGGSSSPTDVPESVDIIADKD